MRRTYGLIVTVVGALLLVNPAAAEETKGRVVNTQPKKEVKPDKTTETPEKTVIKTQGKIEVSAEEKKRAAAAQQAAIAEEQQMISRLRGLQALMEKEERLLAQRLAYAAKIREKGLASNDQKLLDQAEDYERRSLAYYQKRVEQFEKASISSGTSQKSVKQPSRPTSRPTSQPTRSRSSSRTRTRR
jgi:hypothetical protein